MKNHWSMCVWDVVSILLFWRLQNHFYFLRIQNIFVLTFKFLKPKFKRKKFSCRTLAIIMESSKEQFRISMMKSGNQILVVGGCYISRYFWSSFVDILLVGVLCIFWGRSFWGWQYVDLIFRWQFFVHTSTCSEIHL